MKLGIILLGAAVALAAPPSRKVAITIDDLPAGGGAATPCELPALQSMTAKLLAPLRAGYIPVTAFVIGSRCAEMGGEGQRKLLRMWLDAGAELGNHTWSHPDLNATPVPEYTADILRAEAPIAGATGHKPRFFRHPMLHCGPDAGTKRAVDAFLDAHGYRVAPVTLDNSDWMFAYVYARADAAAARRARETYLPYLESIFSFFEKRALEVTGREIPQVLLLHASELNADAMPQILSMIQARGYSFVSLEEALRDPAYSLLDAYAGRGGFSWIHRWSRTKGMPDKVEPDTPDFIEKAYAELRR